MGTTRLWAAVTCSVVFGIFGPSPVRACSHVLPAILSSYPPRGTQDVPTNAVLFAYGAELRASWLSLRDALLRLPSRGCRSSRYG
jgi:hypothetical protein